MNRETSASWVYHDATKHTYRSVRASGHFLDWKNHPSPFKIYPNLAAIPLPPVSEPLPCDALAAISSSIPPGNDQPGLTLETLAALLFLSAGITRRRTHAGGEIYFRAASHTGAMYAIELYLICGPLPDLEAGVYHFSPGDFALRRLRKGDLRDVLVRATGGGPSVAQAPLTIASTGTYWRNAWKYQSRTYRHFGWDNGTLLANLLAAATGMGLSATVMLGFQDEPVNELLGIDTMREVTLSLLPVGHSQEPCRKFQGNPGPLAHENIPYSQEEVDYPAMREMHSASSLMSAAEVREWARPMPPSVFPPAKGDLVPLVPSDGGSIRGDSIDRVILRRGSTRKFALESITFPQLSTILNHSAGEFPADFQNPPGAMLTDLYLIVHAVEGLRPGAYVLHRAPMALELLKDGDFRREAGVLGLDQHLPAEASVVIFFMAGLNPILRRYGNRGYRAVQLEAGILGGKMYLAAYAQMLGATGLTFYDDEVTEFFSPHAAGKSSIFLMAIGKPRRQGDSRIAKPERVNR